MNPQLQILEVGTLTSLIPVYPNPRYVCHTGKSTVLIGNSLLSLLRRSCFFLLDSFFPDGFEIAVLENLINFGFKPVSAAAIDAAGDADGDALISELALTYPRFTTMASPSWDVKPHRPLPAQPS